MTSSLSSVFWGEGRGEGPGLQQDVDFVSVFPTLTIT